jgi:hypothetical protein
LGVLNEVLIVFLQSQLLQVSLPIGNNGVEMSLVLDG